MIGILASILGFTETSIANNIDPDSKSTIMTLEQRRQYLGLIVPEDVRIRFMELDRQPSPVLLNPAEYFDWREAGVVSPVKDQGACGSCWDFASTGAFESAIAIADRNIWDLSEQQVMDCNAEQYGCGGGWMNSVYNLFRDYGAVEEECYPYYAQDGFPCAQDTCVIMAVLDDYVDVQFDVDAIKNALLSGPLSTTLSIPSGFDYNCFQGDWLNADHAVVIVGWDDDMCGGQGGWIVKNSWGRGWGDSGFFYIPYGSCGIGHYTQIPLYNGGRAGLAMNQDSFMIDVPSGGQASEIWEIGNTGGGNLYFRLRSYCLQDSFGYYWRDSESPQGPEYNWVDITQTGEPIDFPGFPGYSNSGPIDLGFDFSFYGNTYSSICVCSEGWASFTDGVTRTSQNKPIPTSTVPNNLLAAFWENLNPTDEDVFFYTNQSDTAVISWIEVPDILNRGLFTFQILLIGDHTVIYQYKSMGPEGPLSDATVGIENATGTVGLEVCYDEFFTYGEKALRFELGQPAGVFDWLLTDTEFDMVRPGETSEVEISCIAGDHLDGSYWACIDLYTNDFDNHRMEIPVVMNVGMTLVDEGTSAPARSALLSCYPNPFNARTVIEYSLSATSSVSLEIFDILGRKIETLAEGLKPAGLHRVTWDAESQPSGVYLYKIRIGDIVAAKKMILIK